MAPHSVLEVGCGDGFFLGHLPETIPKRVGIDLSARAIGFARAFHPSCDFRVQDIANVSEVFDIVAAIEVLEHISDDALPEFIRGIANRLNTYGKAIISVPTTKKTLHKKHYRHYTLALLRNTIAESQCDLEVEDYEYVYAEPWWMNTFTRAFFNRKYSVDIFSITTLAWRHIWRSHRHATPANGHHLIATLRRTPTRPANSCAPNL